MTEIEKAMQVFESIVGLCNEMTTSNISHHRSTIKLQAEYGIEQLEKITKDIKPVTIDDLIAMKNKIGQTLPKQVIEEKDPTVCACGHRHPLVAEFGACGKCMEERLGPDPTYS